MLYSDTKILRGLMFKRLLIPRLQDRFIQLIAHYMDVKGISQDQVANIVEIPPSHLSNLLHKKRTLSASYIINFILKGVIMANELYDGRAMTEKEKEFWTTVDAMQRIKLLHKIVEAEKRGLDVEMMLDSFIKGSNGKR